MILFDHEWCIDNRDSAIGLNPCYSGWYSLIGVNKPNCVQKMGLNPCYSGWYSLIRNQSWIKRINQ